MGAVLNVIARGAQPTIEAETPQSLAAKNLAVQNARQGTEMNALKIQQAERQQASEQAIQRAWQDAGGDLDKTLALAPQYGATPDHLIALQQHVLNTKKTISELDDKALEQHLKHSDIAAGQLNALLQLPEPAAAQQWPQRLNFLLQRGDVKPEELKAAGINPMQYPGHDAVQQFLLGTQGYKGQLSQVLADRKVKAEEQQAEARVLGAQNTAREIEAKLPGIRLKAVQDQRVQDAQTLAAIAKTNPAGLQEALGKLTPESAAVFQGLNKPEEFIAAALTPEQTTQEADKKATRTETAGYHATEAGLRKQEIGIQGARLGLEKQKLGFDMSGGVSPAAQMAAEGKMDPQTVRSMIRKMPGIISQIRQVDPNFDEANIEERYNTLKEFTNTSNTKAGGQLIALNTLIHHADLYSQAADAMKNGNFKPGNAAYNAVATMFGSAPPNNAALVARFLAGETGKVATGGVPAEGEIKGILSNLGTNASPDQMKEAGQKLLEIAAGRATPLLERIKKSKLENVVQGLGPDAKAILAKRGFNPDTMKPVPMIRARDAQGKLHEAPAGTTLPQGWTLEKP